ncbi:MAG: bifunctional oligoribonuclease/PAP phosphatase NrnA [Lachnospiraceae bacterium]|nr:bifunctional oligoribonuclease/PAP phosphatase NrnA [Lachnospiraceae bacterium]
MLNLSNELKGMKSVAISGHIRPDGDCVGSTMATYLYIKKNMPEIDVHIYLEDIPDVFNCIKDVDKIEKADGVDRIFDCFVCCDSVKERIGAAEHIYDNAQKTINIDHHITNPGASDINYIVAEASSASELVFNTLNFENIDEDIAKALYIGIIHDTGVFQYSNVSPSTLVAASKLISFGFDFPTIIAETFYQKTYVQTKVCGEVLENSRLFLDGKVSFGAVTPQMAEKYNTVSKDYDGIVNGLRNITGVDVAIFMYLLDDGSCKVSMRTNNDNVDVSAVSHTFGGGGHKRAAGVTMEGTMEEVLEKLLSEIKKQY